MKDRDYKEHINKQSSTFPSLRDIFVLNSRTPRPVDEWSNSFALSNAYLRPSWQYRSIRNKYIFGYKCMHKHSAFQTMMHAKHK